MNVYEVTGWVQYKTDCSQRINTMQLADTAAEAIEDVKARHTKPGRYAEEHMRFKLVAELR